jgi:hypothetical protein
MRVICVVSSGMTRNLLYMKYIEQTESSQHKSHWKCEFVEQGSTTTVLPRECLIISPVLGLISSVLGVISPVLALVTFVAANKGSLMT